MKFKIVNRARFITVMSVVLFLIIAGLHVTNCEEEKRVIATHTIVAGDTLWSICKEYKPANMDLREYIDQVQKYNNISCNLQIGQSIDLID